MAPYVVHKAVITPEFTGNWNGPAWKQAETLSVASFHPAGSEHKPTVNARVLYDDTTLYVHFKVLDRFIRSLHTRHQDPVCQDSCVEFFFQPRSTPGYFNMEANCGGTLHCSFIEDHQRTPTGFAQYRLIDTSWLDRLRIYHSMPSVVEPELPGSEAWTVEYGLPLSLIETYAGPLGKITGQTWRANFFKCGDKTSHPHWASWAPIGEALNFHQPDRFAPIFFGE
jgi:hypothetical protein